MVRIMSWHRIGEKSLSEPILTKFTDACNNLIEMQNFSFTKMHMKILSAKWHPFCPGGDELSIHFRSSVHCHIFFGMLLHHAIHCGTEILTDICFAVKQKWRPNWKQQQWKTRKKLFTKFPLRLLVHHGTDTSYVSVYFIMTSLER